MMTKEQIMSKILNGGLARVIELESETRGDALYVPEFEMTVKPKLHEITENMAVISFEIYSGTLDTSFTEVSAGMGTDTDKAVEMSLGLFGYSFMNGFKNIADNLKDCTIKSSFAGKTHKWDVYSSNIACSGNVQEIRPASQYWKLLEKDIVKRLGSRKAAYVKIYASNSFGNITGECRINDIPVPELSEKVAAEAKKWSGKGVKSEKQFFFIIQDDSTLEPYIYSGPAGEERLYAGVEHYLRFFSEIQSREDYERIVDTVSLLTGDRTLASECYCMISEMCAESVFTEEFVCGDSFLISKPDGTSVVSYKSQLSDYYMLRKSLFRVLESGVFGENTNKLFTQLIRMSSLYSILEQVKENGAEAKGLEVKEMIFNVPEDFVIR